MHPFGRARERMRALNATKMERMFAKPFIAALDGHIDAIEVLCKKPGTLNTVASGSWDGGAFTSYYHSRSTDSSIIGFLLHNIAEQKQIYRVRDAHKGKISGLCFSEGNRIISCGIDANIKIWDTSPQEEVSVSPRNI